MRTALALADFTDEFVMAEAQKLRTAYRLKTTLRYASTRDHSVHSESVAEHVFGLLYLAQYFLPFEDPERLMDRDRILCILLYHDFGEMVHGDVPYHLKTLEHEEREREAARDVFCRLPPALVESGYGYWLEYETRQTPEARFAYALDKVEPIFELLNPIAERSYKRLRFTYDHYLSKKMASTERFPIMRRFVEVVGRDMHRRGVFWKPSDETITDGLWI